MNHDLTHAEAQRINAELRDLVAGFVPDDLRLPDAGPLWDAADAIERHAVAFKTLLARKVDESGIWKDAGYRSCAEYLAQRSGTTMTMANAALGTSRRLAELPATEAALRSGDLSLGQAETITLAARAAAKASPEKNLHSTEHDLLNAAPTTSLTELREESLRIRAVADDKPEDTYGRLRDQRSLKTHVDGEGAWVLSGRGTVDDGGALLSTITPILIELYAKHSGDQPLKREQLAFDALLEALRRARCYANGIDITNDDGAYWTNTDTGSTATEPEAAEAARPVGLRPAKRSNPEYLTALHLELAALRRGETLAGERCEIAGLGPIPVPRARDLLAEATIKVVVTDADGNVIRVVSLGSGPAAADLIDPQAGRRRQKRTTPTYLALIQVDQTRLDELLGERARQILDKHGQHVREIALAARHPNAAQRFALTWAQPRCTVEGCCRTACEYDHSEDYCRTHWTRLDQLDRLCHHHHRLKTRQGWALIEGSGKRAMVAPDDPRHPANQHQRQPRVA